MPNTLYCGVDVVYRINRDRCFDAQRLEAGKRLSTPNDGPGRRHFLEYLAILAVGGSCVMNARTATFHCFGILPGSNARRYN